MTRIKDATLYDTRACCESQEARGLGNTNERLSNYTTTNTLIIPGTEYVYYNVSLGIIYNSTGDGRRFE